MPSDPAVDVRRDDARVEATGLEVSDLRRLPGFDSLPRNADGTVPADVLCTYADGIDVSSLDNDDQALELAVLFDRLTAWTQGRQASALAEFARRPRTLCEDPVVARAQRAPLGRDVRELGGGDEVAAALALSGRSGQNRLGLATTLAGHFPATLAALTRGAIDLGRAMTLVGEAAACDDVPRAQVEAVVLAGGRRGTPSRFRQAARRAVLRIDAESAVRAAERARQELYVATGPSSVDTSFLDGQLPAEDAMALRLVLDAAADALSGSGETRNRDQLRVAALVAPFWAALASGRLDSVGGGIPLAVAHGQVPALDLDVEHGQTTWSSCAGSVPSRRTPPALSQPAPSADVGLSCASMTVPLRRPTPRRQRRSRATVPRPGSSGTSSTATSTVASLAARRDRRTATSTTPCPGRSARRTRATSGSCADATTASSRSPDSASLSASLASSTGGSRPATSTTSAHPSEASATHTIRVHRTWLCVWHSECGRAVRVTRLRGVLSAAWLRAEHVAVTTPDPRYVRSPDGHTSPTRCSAPALSTLPGSSTSSEPGLRRR